MNYIEMARQIAIEEGVDPDLFVRLIEVESNFNPDAVSSAGALGLAQLMPGTAADLGVDPLDPEENLRGGARYLKMMQDEFGDTRIALQGYNAGPGNVRKYGGNVPFRETQNYVSKILGTGAADRAFNGRSANLPLAMGQPAGEDYGIASTAQMPMFRLPQLRSTQSDALAAYDPYAILQQFNLK
jgi:soluble lytic murein transglycosylase-like protein